MKESIDIETLFDLPSPYISHRSGLLHLPRFIAKIRKFLAGELPLTYQRNFTKGFDGFLCLHLGVEPQQIIALVKSSRTDDELDQALLQLFPKDLKAHIWNRKLVQMGMSPMGREALAKDKTKLGCVHREDVLSYPDLIEFDEGRIK